MRKEKQIIGEEISDESIKLFLGVEPATTPPRCTSWSRPIAVCASTTSSASSPSSARAGYDLDARQGNDFVALVSDQRQAVPYIERCGRRAPEPAMRQ